MSLVLTIKVSPGAKKARFALGEDGMIKCFVSAPPVDGKANAAVTEAFSSLLKIAKSKVTIISGHTSKIKRLEIDTLLTREEFLDLLGLGFVQSKIF